MVCCIHAHVPFRPYMVCVRRRYSLAFGFNAAYAAIIWRMEEQLPQINQCY